MLHYCQNGFYQGFVSLSSTLLLFSIFGECEMKGQCISFHSWDLKVLCEFFCNSNFHPTFDYHFLCIPCTCLSKMEPPNNLRFKFVQDLKSICGWSILDFLFDKFYSSCVEIELEMMFPTYSNYIIIFLGCSL
jgi:hypothetical protein